jgi:alpha-galactosidase
MCPHVTFVYDMRRTNQDYAPVVRLFRQWREEIAPNFWGDYYPLTPFSPDSIACMAFQFDRPEEGSGVVLAFRRAYSPDERLALRLRGLGPGARYTVRDLDTESAETFTGRSLMDTGLAVVFRERPGSAALTYRKEKP